eukprot:gene2730-5376_t
MYLPLVQRIFNAEQLTKEQRLSEWTSKMIEAQSNIMKIARFIVSKVENSGDQISKMSISKQRINILEILQGNICESYN